MSASAPTLRGVGELEIKAAIETIALRTGVSPDEFIRQAATAAGHRPKKAERMVVRFNKGGGTPECVKHHLLSIQQ